MKNLISIIVACMMSLVVASCGGGSNSSEADRIAQLEDSIEQLNNNYSNDIQSFTSNHEDREANSNAIKKETIHKNGLTIIKYGSWIYWEEKNPMNDIVSYYALNQSNNQKSIGGGLTVLGLGLNYIKGQTLINLIVRSGNLRTDLPQVYVRFDNGDIETFGCMADTDQSIFILDARKFMKGLERAKKIAIEVEPSTGGQVAFTFNNSGFEWDYPIVNEN